MSKESSRYPGFLSESRSSEGQNQVVSTHAYGPNNLYLNNELPFTKATYEDKQKSSRSEDNLFYMMINPMIEESVEERPIADSSQKRIKAEEVAKMIMLTPLPEMRGQNWEEKDFTVADLNIPIFGGIIPCQTVKTNDTLEILRRHFPGSF